MAPLPLAKIGKEVIKTVSKPLAKRIKVECTRYDSTQRILVNLGQGANRITHRLEKWSDGEKVKYIPPLKKNEAIQDGADLLGEAIVFGVAIGAVVWEYDHSKDKAEAKEERRLREIEERDLRIVALEEAVAAQSERIDVLLHSSFVGGAARLDQWDLCSGNDGQTSNYMKSPRFHR